jgi:hypothetical protein
MKNYHQNKKSIESYHVHDLHREFTLLNYVHLCFFRVKYYFFYKFYSLKHGTRQN